VDGLQHEGGSLLSIPSLWYLVHLFFKHGVVCDWLDWLIDRCDWL